ncbi:glycosyltransferase, partial [uncultured Clostridium sp.]
YKGKDGNIYSLAFGYDIWERYLKVFDELIICTRQSDIIVEDYKRYKLSSGNNVKFKLNTIYKSPIQFFTEKKSVGKPIEEVVREADCCIIRLPSIIGFLAVEECIRQNKPWAAEVVACCWDSLWNYGNIKGKVLAPIMYALNRKYIKKAKNAIYVTDNFLQKRYPCNGKTAVASNVCISMPKQSVLENRFKRIDNKISTDLFELGIIGCLDVNYKGHKTAIEVIKKLKDDGINVKLKCLGAGKNNRWIDLAKKLGVDDSIEFSGVLPSGEPVLNWLDNIDIFIMPSLQEGLPRSMIEAMSRGCPTVGVKTGGIPELLESRFITKRKDSEALYKLVVNFIKDKELCKNQAIRNFEKSKLYSKESIDMNRTVFWECFKYRV